MKKNKRIEKLLTKPSDYSFTDARALLLSLGYEERNKGSTSGSRVMFYRASDGHKISLHKPHPQDTMKRYAIDDLIKILKEGGDIDE